MNVPAITKLDIMNSLNYVPNSSLKSIKAYIENIMSESHLSAPVKRSLKGIWKDKGFENISDPDEELKAARQELQHSILERKF